MAPAAVDALVATGLVDRHAHGVAFRHEIARSAVLGAVTPGSEPALHETMIAALEATGADASVLTHHAVAAGDAPRILRYAAAAGAEAARSGSHREAVAFYELALRYPGDDRATRAELLEALSTELYLTDRLSDAIEARTQALALRRELADVVAVGAAHRAISVLPLVRGRSRCRASGRTRRRTRFLTAPATTVSWVTHSRTAPSSRRSATTGPRRSGAGLALSGSRTSWTTRPCMALPR